MVDLIVTEKEFRALKIILEHSGLKGITPKTFGEIYFDTPENRHLLEALSNQGNGACYGKKAWRSAGCILGKLQKKGYVRQLWQHYELTEAGRSILSSTESNITKNV